MKRKYSLLSTPTPCISYMLQQGGKPIQWQRRGEALPASSLYHVGQGVASASPWGLSDAQSQFALSQKPLPRGLPSEWKGVERLRSTLWVMTKWRHFQGSRRNWQSLGYTNSKNSKLTGSCLECTWAQLCTGTHVCRSVCASGGSASMSDVFLDGSPRLLLKQGTLVKPEFTSPS